MVARFSLEPLLTIAPLYLLDFSGICSPSEKFRIKVRLEVRKASVVEDKRISVPWNFLFNL